jgi:hypothetical protein
MKKIPEQFPTIAVPISPERRRIIKATAAASAALGLAPFGNSVWAQSAHKIRIGYVSPQTGPLAAFGETDKFVVDGIREAIKAGITIAGKTSRRDLVDSQSIQTYQGCSRPDPEGKTISCWHRLRRPPTLCPSVNSTKCLRFR